MKIALGSDHRGVGTVQALMTHLAVAGHEPLLVGPCEADSCDYPDAAWAVGRAVAGGDADRGALVCGSGIGASIAANKVHGVRAALVHDARGAEMSRRHNDANVLCLAGDLIADDEACRLVDLWLATPFEGGRHARRVGKIAAIERGENPVLSGSPRVGG